MDIELKYGTQSKKLHIPEQARVSILSPARLPIVSSLTDAMNEALANPVGRERFEGLVRRMAPKTVAIAVPDESRPAPLNELLPILLMRLFSAHPKLARSAVTIIVGCGLHPPLGKEALQRVVQTTVAPGCRLISHDAVRSKTKDYGLTSRGTPVLINADVAEADLKISIGQIDPHQFVGFTGGAKGVVIGCAAKSTIEYNHSLMFDEKAQVGHLEGNPVRQDQNEAGEMVGIDLVVNVVLNADNDVVRLLAGEPGSVLREGAKTCAEVYGVRIEEKCDIIIASCGGFPKDICLYQAQKGLNLASHAVKAGGKILLLAASPQGVGDDVYLDYVSQFSTPEEVLEDFKKLGFKMGAHKAYLFGCTLARYDVAVVSDLDPEILKKCQLRPADPESIIQQWADELPYQPLVGVIPNANTTYFY
jgi:nickel-dependent lactate racemase